MCSSNNEDLRISYFEWCTFAPDNQAVIRPLSCDYCGCASDNWTLRLSQRANVYPIIRPLDCRIVKGVGVGAIIRLLESLNFTSKCVRM